MQTKADAESFAVAASRWRGDSATEVVAAALRPERLSTERINRLNSPLFTLVPPSLLSPDPAVRLFLPVLCDCSASLPL